MSAWRSLCERERREATAFHEAAHYTVARALGCRPGRCVVRPGGGGHAELGQTPDPWTAEGCEAFVAVTLAGGLGEAMWFGRQMTAAGSDDRKATAALMRFDREERLRLQADGLALAGRILRADWELVTVIARELVEHGQWPR